MRTFATSLLAVLLATTFASAVNAQSWDNRHWRGQHRDDLRQQRSLYDPTPAERRRARRHARREFHRQRNWHRRNRRARNRDYGYGHRYGCKSKRAIIRGLRSADLNTHTMTRSGGQFHVIAHNSRKDRYDLRVDACTGQILYIRRTKQVAKKGLKRLLKKWF